MIRLNKTPQEVPPGLSPLTPLEKQLIQQMHDESQKVSKYALVAFFQNIASSIERLFSESDIEKLGGGEKPIRAQDLVRLYKNTSTIEFAKKMTEEQIFCQGDARPHTALHTLLKTRLNEVRHHLNQRVNSINPKPYELDALMRVNTALKIENSNVPILAPQNKDKGTYFANFRDDGLLELCFPKNVTDNEHIKQIRKDERRYKGLTNVNDIVQAIKKEPIPSTRKNILFGCSQKFEITLARWFTPLFGRGDNITVSQCKDAPPSRIKCDVNARQTMLKCQFQARDFSKNPKQSILVEKFDVTAIYHWDTCEVFIFKQKIK